MAELWGRAAGLLLLQPLLPRASLAGRSASGRHPAMPDHWWCAHQDAPFSSAVSMASPAVSSAPLSSAADFVLGPGGAPLLRLSPMDRAQIALYFGVLAIGYHTLRGADSRPPPDAIAVSEGCFERARLLVLTCIDAPNHYAVTTLLLLAQFSFGYLRTRAASIHASLAWRLARACGLAEDSGLGFLCSLFRHYMCEDLEQLPVPPRLLPRAASLLQPPDRGGSSDAGSAPAPSSSPATCSSPTPPPVLVVPTLAQPPASGAAAPQPSTWSQLASPSPSLAAPPAIAIGGGDGGIGGARPVSQQLSPVVAELAAPCEALAPREIDDAYVAAAALCGGRLTINGTSDGTAKTPPSADGRSAELHLRYLDQRVSLLLVVVVSRMSLLRRGLSNLVNKREVWRLADELVEISALPGAAMPLARLANIYGLKAITARQAGQHSHAQVWAIAAIGLWRRVPVTHIAQNFVVGFIARHTALIALSSELQAAAAAFMGGEAGSSSGASSGATSRSGVDSSVPSSRSAASSLGVTHAAASAAALQAGGPERGGLPADTGRASSSGGFDMPSEREAAVVSTGLPPLHEYRHFAAIALMFAAVAHFWPAHARSFTGLLAEATAMLQGANESLARTLGLPAFRAPTPASTTARSLQSFASSSGGDSSTRAADVTAAAASPSPDDMQGGGGMSGSGARREVGGGARALSGGPSEKWGIRRFGDPPARSVPARGESLMTSLVLESDAAGAPQSGSQAAVATRGKARVLASPLDLLCMVVRKEQPLAVPPQQLPQAAPPPFYAEAAAAALLPPLGGQLEPASSFFYGSGGGRGVGGNGSSSLGAIGDMTMRSMSGDLTTRVAAGPLPGVGGQLQAPTLPQSLLVGGQGLDMGGLHHQPQQPQQQRFGGAGETTSGPLGALQEHDSDDYDDDFSDDGGADVAGREWLQLGGPQQQHRPHASSESAAAAASAHRAAAGSKRPRDSSGGVHPSSGATASSNAASRLLPPPPQHNVPMLRLGGGSGGGGLSLSSSGAFLPDTARGSGSGLDSARGAMGSLSVAAPFLGPPTARLTEAPPPLMGGGSVGGGGHEVAAARGTANGTSQGAPLAPWHAEADDLAM